VSRQAMEKALGIVRWLHRVRAIAIRLSGLTAS
jgi:hypothetical protein